MSLVSAADAIKALKILEQKIKWVSCPYCRDEVTKLRPCGFWLGGKNVMTHVCVECAESSKGFEYIPKQYPIPGVEISHDRYNRLVISYGSFAFILTRRGSGIAVLEAGKTSDQEKTYENNFQAWFALKNAFEKPEVRIDPAIRKGKWK